MDWCSRLPNCLSNPVAAAAVARRFFHDTKTAPRTVLRRRTVADTAMAAIAALERPDGSGEATTVGRFEDPDANGPDVRDGTGAVSLDGPEGEDMVDAGGWSDAFHAIWIMGAKMLRLGTAALGIVAKLKPSKRPLLQVTVVRVMVRTTAMHVWPFWLWQLKPCGQHPTAVSPGCMRNCITQSTRDDPAVAEHADVKPAGQEMPGE